MDKPSDTQTTVNDSATCGYLRAPVTQSRSVFDLEETPESRGAMAALNAKVAAQSCTSFFDDPIHIRRSLIAKRDRTGADTPYGHTCSNIIEQLEGMFNYERPAWAIHETQTLPWMMNKQIERLGRLSNTAGG